MKISDLIKLYIIFLAGFAVQLIITLIINNWNFAYPLDDSYIHLVIAKNFAQYGIWGLVKFDFVSASSSVIYTLILSIFFKAGFNSVLLPLILNLITVFLILSIIYFIAQKESWSRKIYFIISGLILIFAPSIALVITGLEHSMQIAVTLLLVYKISKGIIKKPNIKEIIILSILSILAVSLRYESLFIILPALIILLYKKQFQLILIILISSLVPVAAFGLISIANGSFFLPNSLLIKGLMPDTTFLGIFKYSFYWVYMIFRYPHLLSCFILLTLNFISYRIIRSQKPKKIDHNQLTNKNGIISYKSPSPKSQIPSSMTPLEPSWFYFSLIVTIAFILHLTFARIGWFYRYEAYLLVLSIFSCGHLLNGYFKSESTTLKSLLFHKNLNRSFGFFKRIKMKILFTILLIILPLSYRFISSIYKSSLAPKNIYEQQVQSAKFINQYKYRSVIVNDIGAMSYFNDINILDVAGIGNTNVIRAIRTKTYNMKFIDSLSMQMNSEIAILYDKVTEFELPPAWKKAGSFSISNNVVCWKKEVNFYAVGNTNIDSLKKQLIEFHSKMPDDVIIKIND